MSEHNEGNEHRTLFDQIANLSDQLEMAELLVGALVERVKEATGSTSVTVNSRHFEAASGNEYMAAEQEDMEGGFRVTFTQMKKKGEG